MATVTWKGGALAVVQENRVTPGTVEIGDIFTLTIANKTVNFTATATTVANVTAGLATAWNASTEPEMMEITASDETTYLELLADTAGKPFTQTSSTTDGGGNDTQTLVTATQTANAGPNDWSTAANWSGNAAPVNADDVVLELTSDDIKYGLAQSAVTVTTLTIRQSFTGTVGLARDETSYTEYRLRYLEIGATTITIGQGAGSGSGRLNIDTKTIQTALNVHNSAGSPLESSLTPILWKGTHAANVLNITKGILGCAYLAGETAVIATVNCNYESSQTGDVTLKFGDGMTFTTINQIGGTLTLKDAVTTYNQDGGTLDYRSGTITTLNAGAGGTLECRLGSTAKTITNCNVYKSYKVRDPAKTLTFTNGIDLVRCGVSDVTLDIGDHQTLTPSAI